MTLDVIAPRAVMLPPPGGDDRDRLDRMVDRLVAEALANVPHVPGAVLAAPRTPRRVYVATSFANAHGAALAAAELAEAGHLVVSNWHRNPPPAAHENLPDVRGGICRRNVDDLRDADTVVVLASRVVGADPAALRGALVELALAWSWGHRIVVVGDRLALTLMVDLPDVRWCATLGAALDALAEVA